MGQWNSYFNALIYIRDENLYPLALIMRNILVTQQIQSALGTGEAALIALRKANLMRYAMIIVATVPIMCVLSLCAEVLRSGCDDRRGQGLTEGPVDDGNQTADAV